MMTLLLESLRLNRLRRAILGVVDDDCPPSFGGNLEASGVRFRGGGPRRIERRSPPAQRVSVILTSLVDEGLREKVADLLKAATHRPQGRALVAQHLGSSL